MLKKKEKVLVRQKSPGQGLDMKSSTVCTISLRLDKNKEVQIPLWAGKFFILIGMALVNLYLPRQKANKMLDDLKFGK